MVVTMKRGPKPNQPKYTPPVQHPPKHAQPHPGSHVVRHQKPEHEQQTRWVPDIFAEFERCWKLTGRDYMSISEIASHISAKFKERGFSVTRNACIGKADRSGLRATFPRKGTDGLRSPDHTRKTTRTGVVSMTAHRIVATAKRVQRPLVDDEPPPEGGVPMVDATDKQCRWPTGMKDGVQMCCGGKVWSASLSRPSFYCVQHGRASTDRTRSVASLAERNANDAHYYGTKRKPGLGNLNKFR